MFKNGEMTGEFIGNFYQYRWQVFQFYVYSSRLPKEIKNIFILNIQNKMFSYTVVCYPNNMLLRIKLSFLALKTSDCIENKEIIIFFENGHISTNTISNFWGMASIMQ